MEHEEFSHQSAEEYPEHSHEDHPVDCYVPEQQPSEAQTPPPQAASDLPPQQLTVTFTTQQAARNFPPQQAAAGFRPQQPAAPRPSQPAVFLSPQPVAYPPPQQVGSVPKSPQPFLAPPSNPTTPVHGGLYQPQSNSQGWTTELFDCFDDPTNAFITCFMPCVTFGQIAEIIDRGHTTCLIGGVIYGFSACVYSHIYRRKLRSMFGLVEAPAPDLLVHLVCELCSLCQIYRELNKRGLNPAIGWEGNMSSQAVQGAMVPPTKQVMMG